MDTIPLAARSGWATNANVEWPPMAQQQLSTEYALEVLKILLAGLNEFEAIPDGEPQWLFEAQDCFQGRERTARAEGHLADGSAMWPCGGNLEVPLTALVDFFPVDRKAYIQVANDEDGQVKEVPFYAGLRWRKLARGVASSDGVHPPEFGELELPTFDEMCQDLAFFGCTATSARQGDVQHFGAYILDMLYTIYAAQRGALRTTSLFGQCPNWCACLWDRPEYWSHITNDQK
eukprot:86190-Amphidinium_carterae.1